MLERTVPRDGCKEAFFRNFVCLINDYGSIPKVPMLQAFRVFAEWDNYPAPEGNWARQNARGDGGANEYAGEDWWLGGLQGPV